MPVGGMGNIGELLIEIDIRLIDTLSSDFVAMKQISLFNKIR